MSDCRLLMISAMYENGGNVTHRFLDGHPDMFVYPFESQLGTTLVNDYLTSMFPVKYRWPVFSLAATPEQDFQAIIDEECRVRLRTPQVSKFRHAAMDLSDTERADRYVQRVRASGRSTGHNVAAFFGATFDAWKDYRRGSNPSVYVGYSPIVGVDTSRIVDDLPQAHVLHIVRNPWAAYADTKKRPKPLSLAHYMTAWTTVQYHALLSRSQCPSRVHVIRAEDVMADSQGTLGALCQTLGVQRAPSLSTMSWNGEPLQEAYPWGTLRRATPDVNLATARELTAAEQDEVTARAAHYLDDFDYQTLRRQLA
jgi:hypothetical protein